jgi:hypothetical protein
MKSYSKLSGIQRVTVIGALVGLSSVVSASAQTYNVVTVANFALTGFKQTGDAVTPVRMGNKEIIAALNASGQFSFGSGAEIVMISLEDQLPAFGIRERNGTNVVTTGIGSFFNLSESDEIHTSNNLTSYVVQDYHFDNHNGTSFSVSGLSTLKRGNISGPGFGPLKRVSKINSQVNGPGSVNGDQAVLRGAMSAGSPKAERAE